MKKKNNQKKELTINRTTWEQFHRANLKATIMKRHIEYQALYGDIVTPPVIKTN